MNGNDYPQDSRGVLFGVTNKRSDKAPDVTGNIEVGPDLLREMVNRYTKDGKGTIKLRVVGWRKQAKSGGGAYMSLAVSLDQAKEKDDDVPFSL